MKARNITWVLAAMLLLAVALLTGCDSSAGELAPPASVSYDGEILSWPAVENAQSYSVKIGDGEPLTVRSNSYAYRANGETFTVEICSRNEKGKKLTVSEPYVIQFKPLESGRYR